MKPSASLAFSRVDLLVVLAAVAVLAGLFALTRVGERGRIARCSRNLAVLGRAMRSYAQDHQGGLPPAGRQSPETAWDLELVPYLAPELGGSKSPSANRQLIKNLAADFRCPSDSIKRDYPRSYAMAGNNMSPEQWPPGGGSATGVGLWWDRNAVLTLLGGDALDKPDQLPAVNLHDIPAPADTVLLTELISPNNVLASVRECNVIGASRQREAFKDHGASFHGGKFNYLMADGHVEPLSPLQTGSYDGTAGIWSLKK